MEEPLELWDIYDRNGDKKNRTHKRGESLSPGDFHMVVENWIKNEKGQFLIQKRAKPLRNYIDPWSTTAGSAIAGESSIVAVQRETQEEIGLFFELQDLHFIQRTFFSDFFMDVYESMWNGKIEDINFDPKEVTDVKWLTVTEIRKMYKLQKFYSHRTAYLESVLG